MYNTKHLESIKISIFEDIVNALPRIYFEFLALLGLTLIIFYFVDSFYYSVNQDYLLPYPHHYGR